MKKQILVISGGYTFDNYSDYLKDLNTKSIDLERLKYSLNWHNALAEDLGEKYEVFVPKMPNVANSKYQEWAVWFERIVQLLDKQVILVGHSLGAIFLVKYLSENSWGKEINAVILVAPPYNETKEESLGDFKLTKPFDKLRQQAKRVLIAHSEDDLTVPVADVYEYKKLLPEAELLILKDRGHFKQAHFPELVSWIKKI